MIQRLTLFIRFVVLLLSRRRAMALVDQIQASNLSDCDRDVVLHIVRIMLRLPEPPESKEPSPPAP